MSNPEEFTYADALTALSVIVGELTLRLLALEDAVHGERSVDEGGVPVTLKEGIEDLLSELGDRF